jgi:hypothetical protein
MLFGQVSSHSIRFRILPYNQDECSNEQIKPERINSYWMMFNSESFASDHLKNLNLLHSEVLRPSQDLIPRQSRIVRISTAQARGTVAGTLPLAANTQVVTTTKSWAIRTMIKDRTPLLLLFENPSREIVRILDRENETL